MKWIKINPYHRPDVGHALLATFNAEEGGTLYFVTEKTEEGFTIEGKSTNNVDFPEGQKPLFFIPYNLIPITNLHIWDRDRENEIN